MKRRNLYLCILAWFCIGADVSLAQEDIGIELSEAQIAAAVEASKKTRGKVNFWRSEKSRVIFGYDERWAFGNPSQESTEAVVSWKTRQSGGLMASCYLETAADTGIARMTQDDIRRHGRQVVDALLRNSRTRDPQVRLIKWRAAIQDNLPVVYSERDIQIQNINKTYRVRLYSIATSWKGREINFECASEIPLTTPQMAAIVEGPIERILSSLQFIRDPA